MSSNTPSGPGPEDGSSGDTGQPHHASAATPPPPGRPPQGPSPQRPSRFNPKTMLLFPSLQAGAAYFAGAVATTLLLLLTLAGIMLSGSDVLVPEMPMTEGMPGNFDGAAGFAAVLTLPFQVLAMACFGALSGTASMPMPMFGNMTADLVFYGVPLTLTVLLAAALVFSGWYVERLQPASGPSVRWLQSAVSGVVLALLALLLTLMAAVQVEASDGMGISIHLDAVSMSLFFGALVLGVVATMAGRARRADGGFFGPAVGFSLPRMPLRSAGLFITHVVLFSCIAVPALIVVAGVKAGWIGVLSSPLWAINAAVGAFGVGHLSGLGSSMSAEGFLQRAGDQSNVTYVFGMTPEWGSVLTVLCALVVAVAVSMLWKLRRDGAGVDLNNPATWLTLPIVYGIGGLLLMGLSYVSLSFEVTQLGSMQGSVSLAWWTFLVLALWGLAVEVSARLLAPLLVQLLPERLAARMAAPVHNPRSAGMDQASGVRPAQSDDGSGVPADSTARLQQVDEQQPHLAGQQQDSPQAPMDPRTKRKVWLTIGIIGIAVVLVVAATVTVSVINAAAYGPDKKVSAYLDALEAGDASAALELAEPNVANAQRVLLTDKVFKGAKKRIDGYTITDTEVQDDEAVISVDVRQDGRQAEMEFQARKSGTNNVFFDEWTLQQPQLGGLQLTSQQPVESLKINGISVKMPEKSSSASLWMLPAYPGEYVVELDGKSKYLTLGQQTGTVTANAGDMPSIHLELAPSDEMAQEATNAAKAYLDKCLESTSLQPDNCPNEAYAFSFSDSGPRNVQWTLTDEPELEVSRDWQGGWSVETMERGEAEVSYEVNESFDSDEPDWQKDSDTSSITFTGAITLNDGDMEIEFSRY